MLELLLCLLKCFHLPKIQEPILDVSPSGLSLQNTPSLLTLSCSGHIFPSAPASSSRAGACAVPLSISLVLTGSSPCRLPGVWGWASPVQALP